jgi:hypothetical protein
MATVLAVVMAASAFLHARPATGPDPWAISDDGVGPLRLGRDYDEAVALARIASPRSAFTGEGCDGRDEISYSGMLDGLPVTVMAMADAGRISEVEVTLDSPRQAPDEAACLATREMLTEVFGTRFGARGDEWLVEKPLSREYSVRVAPVVVAARWFDTGGSCYVSAAFQHPKSPINNAIN